MSASARPLKIAIPNKGRLSDDSVRLLRQAGLSLHGSTDRRLFASALGGRIQVLFLRAQDIPKFVAGGTVDVGITGHDVIAETGHDLQEHLDLGFGSCRLVVAVPDEHPAQSAEDLPDGVRLATSFPNLTARFFDKLGKQPRITSVSGACEVAPTLGIADAITDLTSTGSTLMQNHLREIGTIATSTCRVVTAQAVDVDVAVELDRLIFALKSVVDARDKRYLLADIPRDQLDEVRSFLPGVAGPTVVDIAGKPDLVAIQVVVDEAEIFDAVDRLKRLGARGILVVPIDRLVD